MKTSLITLSVLSALCMSTQASALGFVALPATGFSASAYTNCFNDARTSSDPKGNFGSYPIASAQYPSSTVNNTCWVAKPSSNVVLPSGLTGYTLVGSQSSPIPTSTGAGGNIGTLTDIAWRNSSTNMCVIGTQVLMINADHDTATTGTQYFEVNDIARGGFSGLGSVNVAYTIFASPVTTASPAFRVGRTFTSVQHRALQYNTLANQAVNGTNYLDLPTKNSVTANITGQNSPINATTPASTTAATQDAVVNDNWVDFTNDAVYQDDDGSPAAYSAFSYIQASCTANPTLKAGAVRLRQTAQEATTFKDISMTGYAIGTP